MKVTFWGTRGSIANGSAANVTYGGNTSCVEVRTNAGTLIVLDCGTGGFPLGQAIISSSSYPNRGYLLISHTHWDHIQGIPFFAPLFENERQWTIFAPSGLYQSLKETLAGQMNYTYSPITINDMGAQIEYKELVEGVFEIEDVRISTRYLNHPALTLGYRLEADDVSVVYACDHEQVSKKAVPGAEELTNQESSHINFLRGADLVIHDAQYTAEDYDEKAGWGHSTAEFAIAASLQAGVRQLALTHHDPMSHDKKISSVIDKLRNELNNNRSNLELVAAAEGLTLDVSPAENQKVQSAGDGFPAEAEDQSAIREHSLFLGTIHPDSDKVIRRAAIAENIPIRTVNSSDEAYGEQTPSLIIIDAQTPQEERHEIHRIVSNQMRADQPEVPVVVVSYGEDERQQADEEIKELATDWMTWPFSEQYARTKLSAWMLRANCRWIRAELPSNEKQRIASLKGLDILRTEPEERFDRITRLASTALEMPIALVSLVDEETQWFKSCIGLDVRETSREVAFCAHAILEDKILEVPDTLLDHRFADNPLVTNAPKIRFYAGCPIKSPDGFALGTLCLIDNKPRQLDSEHRAMLIDLAGLVETEIRESAR